MTSSSPTAMALSRPAGLHGRMAGREDWPFDVLERRRSEGMIGYLIERELAPRLPHKRVVSLLTLVKVTRTILLFDDPIKPIRAGL